MGYELSLSCGLGDEDEVLWYCCGWDKAELFDAMCRLGETRTEVRDDDAGGSYELTYGVVPVDSLAFLVGIESRCSASELWVRYRRLMGVDEALAEEWYRQLAVDSRADMALCFIEGVDETCECLEVARLAYVESCRENPYFVRGLAEAVARAADEGTAELFVFGG